MIERRNVIRVPHPEMGYVEFHAMSLRQLEVLNEAKRCLSLYKKATKLKKKSRASHVGAKVKR